MSLDGFLQTSIAKRYATPFLLAAAWLAFLGCGTGGPKALTEAVTTLQDLGSQDFTIPAFSKRQTSGPVPYVLPANAAQGPESWYLLSAHFRISFDEQTGPGFAWFSASTNGYAAIQVEFELLGASEGLFWSTTDLVDGSRKAFTFARDLELTTTNYMQVRGVNPGYNLLTFQIEKSRSGDVRIKEVTVFRDSAIIRTPLRPPTLKVEVRGPQRLLKVGEDFSLNVVVTTLGAAPAKGVRLSVAQADNILMLTGPNTRQFPEVDTRVQSVFHFKAVAAGRSSITLDVTSANAGRRRFVTYIDVQS